MSIIDDYKARRQKRIDDNWITVHPNGGEGHHVLLGEGGEVKGGAGGSLNGKTLGHAQSKPVEHLKSVSKAPEAAKNAPQASSVEYVDTNTHDFSQTIHTAKQSLDANVAWRVTPYDEADYHNMELHKTKGGSVYALHDGDIVSVCRAQNDTVRGKDLIAEAVKHGGKKLDSYEGNYGFYLKCGFEPVSWCEWNEEYAPEDWKPEYGAEDIIFFKYTGTTEFQNMSKEELKKHMMDFKQRVPSAGQDYDKAKEQRDATL